jgi:hypothetical protein
MRYLLPFILLFAIGCNKTPKTQPVVKPPTIDTPKAQKRIFKGDYIMYDSIAYRGTSNYPQWYDTLQFQINHTISIEIDSITETIISGRDTFKRESPTSTKYSRRRGAPMYWNVTEDSVTYYFWDSGPVRSQIDTYVRGYRKK